MHNSLPPEHMTEKLFGVRSTIDTYTIIFMTSSVLGYCQNGYPSFGSNDIKVVLSSFLFKREYNLTTAFEHLKMPKAMSCSLIYKKTSACRVLSY